MIATLKTRSEMGLGPIINREWAMPSPDTFGIGPIASLAWRYLFESSISVDVFARNSSIATFTNDLSVDTKAEYHMDALDFLVMLKDRGVRPDLVLFDPPYSPRQIAECYQSIGKALTQKDTQRASGWTEEKKIIADILVDGGIAICCGWNSNGIGLKRRFKMEEILLVAHGGGHNDTIVTVERKSPNNQVSLFEAIAKLE